MVSNMVWEARSWFSLLTSVRQMACIQAGANDATAGRPLSAHRATESITSDCCMFSIKPEWRSRGYRSLDSRADAHADPNLWRESCDGSSAAWHTEAVPASSTDRVPRLASSWTHSFTHAPGHAIVKAVAERVFCYGGIGYCRVLIATCGRCCQLRDHRSLCRIQGDDTVHRYGASESLHRALGKE